MKKPTWLLQPDLSSVNPAPNLRNKNVVILTAIKCDAHRASFIDDDSNVVATSGGDLMETELDVPHRRSHMPAVHDQEPSNYYASLRNPDGSLYDTIPVRSTKIIFPSHVQFNVQIILSNVLDRSNNQITELGYS